MSPLEIEPEKSRKLGYTAIGQVTEFLSSLSSHAVMKGDLQRLPDPSRNRIVA
jgi:hypothetical protein